MSNDITPGRVVTDPDRRLVGDVLAVFDGGNLGQVATVSWRRDAGAGVQYNVGARWLKVVPGVAPRDLAPLAPHACEVCQTPFAEIGTNPDRYGTCRYSQCVDAAWPEFAYRRELNRVDRPFF